MTMKLSETKNRIIQAALEILSTNGAPSLTSGKLCAALNMSKGTLFHHFDNMNELHLALLDYIFIETDPEFDSRQYHDIYEYNYHLTESIMAALEKYQNVYAALFSFFSQSIHNPDMRQKLRDHLNSDLELWTNNLFSRFENTLSANEKDNIVRMIDMYFYGLIAHCIIFQDPDRYKTITLEFMDIITNYIESAVRSSKNHPSR